MFLVLLGSGGPDILTVLPVVATGWNLYAVIFLLEEIVMPVLFLNFVKVRLG